jgi:Na+/H+ antiporter
MCRAEPGSEFDMPNMEIVLALLAAAAVLSGAARYINVPYPVVLVVGGVVVAAIPGTPTISIPPDVVFLVFLPPLLYSAAYSVSPAELRDNAASISLLAIGLVFVTIAAVAAVAHAALGLSWPVSFVLGAILGATDPVASTSVLRKLGAPRRIATLLEGEALLNDGTALTAYKVAVAAVAAQSFSLAHGALDFIAVSAGGIAVGVAVGWLSTVIRRRLDDANLEITVAIMTAYAAYIAADRAGVSGVLSAVAAGIVVGRSSTDISSPPVRLQSQAFWQVSTFILDALLFLLVGLELRAVAGGMRGSSTGSLAWQCAAVVATLMAIRLAWMFVIPALVGSVSRRLPARPSREKLVLGWSGMRGALSVAAALSLPAALGDGRPFPDRALVVFIAVVVTCVTLVVPGLTLAPLIRALGLAESGRRRREAAEARLRVIRAALLRFDQIAEADGLPERALARVRERYETRAAALERRLAEESASDKVDELAAERRLLAELTDAERNALRKLAAERAAPTDVVREIERDLDLEESRRGGS